MLLAASVQKSIVYTAWAAERLRWHALRFFAHVACKLSANAADQQSFVRCCNISETVIASAMAYTYVYTYICTCMQERFTSSMYIDLMTLHCVQHFVAL